MKVGIHWRNWLLVGAIALLLFPNPAALTNSPLTCRTTAQHTVCIFSIKRSAKNFWQYRAVVSVDGVRRPEEIYDCSDLLRVTQNGSTLRFRRGGAGEVICKLFKQRA